MTERIERDRVLVTESLLPLHMECWGKCHRTIVLKFNGGELDRAECCGYRYTLQSTGIDLVIEGPRE